MRSDEVLMLEFQNGSRDACEELFARYRYPLYGFFYRRLRVKDRAEDLTQETFLVVLRAIHSYQRQALVRTYLYSIAMKLLLGERRRQARAAPADLEVEPGAGPGQDEVLVIRQALDKLEPLAREVVMLREYEQLSYAEIAELLRIPVNTVRSRLFRSRVTLRALLRPETRRDQAPAQNAAGLAGKETSR